MLPSVRIGDHVLVKLCNAKHSELMMREERKSVEDARVRRLHEIDASRMVRASRHASRLEQRRQRVFAARACALAGDVQVPDARARSLLRLAGAGEPHGRDPGGEHGREGVVLGQC